MAQTFDEEQFEDIKRTAVKTAYRQEQYETVIRLLLDSEYRTGIDDEFMLNLFSYDEEYEKLLKNY